MPLTKSGPSRPITASPGIASASAMPACMATIQKPTWQICFAIAERSPTFSAAVITGPRIGSKLVLSFCGSVATCWTA